jgi:hypothetical protein
MWRPYLRLALTALLARLGRGRERAPAAPCSCGEIRTPDPSVNGRLLCQLSYAGMMMQRFTVLSGPGALSAFVAGTGVEPAIPGL